jgi:endogenous inhibitor of DNA gyrase (YacG/DUF329 family)
MQVKCQHCNKNVEPITTVQAYIGGTHVRADCPDCGRWIKWLPKGSDKEVNKELLDKVKDNLKNIWQKKS